MEASCCCLSPALPRPRESPFFRGCIAPFPNQQHQLSSRSLACFACCRLALTHAGGGGCAKDGVSGCRERHGSRGVRCGGPCTLHADGERPLQRWRRANRTRVAAGHSLPARRSSAHLTPILFEPSRPPPPTAQRPPPTAHARPRFRPSGSRGSPSA
ncbi:hypothetical protein CALCODRAFT_37614 [Calocera cornea HHB12733]|uniref:Uncharacterized protein n=1 Tax=Calocera cornea HHB12733 TaxID=1353952 RepID=A0A165DXV4_9BASI|nr:hypothetical protein CALCODRAFT_37614 [Calocera cornea HHB12733]